MIRRRQISWAALQESTAKGWHEDVRALPRTGKRVVVNDGDGRAGERGPFLGYSGRLGWHSLIPPRPLPPASGLAWSDMFP